MIAFSWNLGTWKWGQPLLYIQLLILRQMLLEKGAPDSPLTNNFHGWHLVDGALSVLIPTTDDGPQRLVKCMASTRMDNEVPTPTSLEENFDWAHWVGSAISELPTAGWSPFTIPTSSPRLDSHVCSVSTFAQPSPHFLI